MKWPRSPQPPEVQTAARAKRLETEYDRFELGQMSRRTMLRGTFGSLCIAAFADLEQKVDGWWRSGDTTLRMVSEGLDKRSMLFGVSFGGFGEVTATPMALDMSNATHQQISWAGLVASNEYGENLRDNKVVLQRAQRQRNFKYIAIDGESIGGMLGLESALQAHIPVGALLLNSSPFNLSNARFSGPAELAASKYNPSNRLVETTELAVADLGGYIKSYGIESFINRFFEVIPAELAHLQGEGSPMLRTSQLRDAASIDLNAQASAFRREGIIDPRVTKVAYVETPYPYQDNVIHTESAYDDWSEWFDRHFQIPVTRLYMEGSDSHHADAYAAARVSESWWQDEVLPNFDRPINGQLL